ncbi:MAG: T9SS type A sorting domain-containing protein [Melioribacteraceae bacterium]|nr:T9SS type A sorting domain-containing protein [Melioribacteraceae bacterium]MCF8354909.1 T9SS type A sorting domain-containing protein [Melioribacteraceae bacterium]MCF8395234.1 T9SS type A sorting domain-containing protein [Melioribacteraceae bacterium]MCF8420720.1 T9SS type A sorting domain-containing protein [Melioribacteraceae bacterium]
MFLTEDNGLNWEQVTNQSILKIEVDNAEPRNIYCITGDNDFIRIVDTFHVTGINNASIDHIINFELYQNYPNPFNPRTNIVYQIPKEGRVVIKLYDILGREMQTLVNEEKIQGRYEFTFNGTKLSSGVYIYRITAGEFTANKKLLLMK